MHPVLYCPAVGLCLVLRGGWAHALPRVALMGALQAVFGAQSYISKGI